ncbi:MAG: hypothetical protein U0Q55_15200 [Vicinamibacterales bacterium]
MSHTFVPGRRILAAVVLLHLAITLVHRTSHVQARVPLSAGGTAFVLVVVLALPLVGLALLWRTPRSGAALIAAAMAAAFVFGVVNHFVLVSPDHVSHVDVAMAPLFGVSAAGLALTELAGAALGATALMRRVRA